MGTLEMTGRNFDASVPYGSASVFAAYLAMALTFLDSIHLVAVRTLMVKSIEIVQVTLCLGMRLQQQTGDEHPHAPPLRRSPLLAERAATVPVGESN
jgi:hypothetical protein